MKIKFTFLLVFQVVGFDGFACNSSSNEDLADSGSDTSDSTDTDADTDTDTDTDTDADTDTDTDADTDTNGDCGGAACLASTDEDSGGDVNSDSDAAESVLYVDVRNPNEYDTGHCVDAINIPLSELESHLDELGDKSRHIIVYCASGNRSRQAATILDANGFTNVEDGGAFGSLACDKTS